MRNLRTLFLMVSALLLAFGASTTAHAQKYRVVRSVSIGAAESMSIIRPTPFGMGFLAFGDVGSSNLLSYGLYSSNGDWVSNLSTAIMASDPQTQVASLFGDFACASFYNRSYNSELVRFDKSGNVVGMAALTVPVSGVLYPIYLQPGGGTPMAVHESGDVYAVGSYLVYEGGSAWGYGCIFKMSPSGESDLICNLEGDARQTISILVTAERRIFTAQGNQILEITSTGTWLSFATIPVPSGYANFAAFELARRQDGKWLVHGWTQEGDTGVAHVIPFDPQTKTFGPVSTFPSSWWSLSLAQMAGGNLLWNHVSPEDGSNAATILEPYWDEVDPPSTGLATSPATPAIGWHQAAVGATLSAVDQTFGAGVKEIRYTVDMGAEQVVAGSSASISLTDNGIHTIAYHAIDNVGNVEPTQYATIKIDSVAPVPTATVAYGTLTVSATDNLSGVASVHVKIDNGAWVPYTSPMALPPSAKVVVFKATDHAGNVSPERTTFVGQFLKSLSISPSPVYSGSSVSVKVELIAPAPAGGVQIGLISSDQAVLALPSTLNFAGGATRASVAVDAGRVSADTLVSVEATAGDTSLRAHVPVLVPVPKSLVATPTIVSGGSPVSLKLTLVSKAPTGGQVVELESLNPTVLSVPSSVTVPAGQVFRSVSGTTVPIAADTVVLVVARVDDTVSVCSVVVRRVAVSRVSFTPNSVVGGSPATLRVTLTRPAPAGGIVLPVVGSGSGASLPATVNVPGGSTVGSVLVSTQAVANDQAMMARVALGGGSARATLAVTAPRLTRLSISPSTVRGGQSAVGTITLSGPAPAGGVLVKLATNAPTVAGVPPTVLVPAGASTVTFAIVSQPVASGVNLLVTAFQNLDSRTATLTVVP